MIPGKLSPEKWFPKKWSPENWSPKKKSLEKCPSKIVLRQKNPGKMVPEKLRNEKSWGGHRASWCVCGMLGCDQSMKTQNSTQTQNSETNPKLGNKKSWGERASSIVVCVCVCVECSDVINLWKLKTRQPIFLDSFSVLQFVANVGSWRKRQTYFCVCSGINW